MNIPHATPTRTPRRHLHAVPAPIRPSIHNPARDERWAQVVTDRTLQQARDGRRVAVYLAATPILAMLAAVECAYPSWLLFGAVVTFLMGLWCI